VLTKLIGRTSSGHVVRLWQVRVWRAAVRASLGIVLPALAPGKSLPLLTQDRHPVDVVALAAIEMRTP
jgi:hypothetical protein